MDEEMIRYMKMVGEARRSGVPVEASKRLNALFVAAGEEYYGSIFKWDAFLIPGPLQLKDYHYTVAPKVEPTASEQRLDTGWRFKTERREALEGRSDQLKIQFLVGETALFQLRRESEALCREQIRYLRNFAERPGWEIRVLAESIPAGQSNFEIYDPGESLFGGPPFLYIETFDSSWCIYDPDRIAGYHDFRKYRWKRAIRIEDYGNDD